MVGRIGFEISATVLCTLSGLSFNARSARATMPITWPSPSITGIRLTWCSCMRRSHLSTFSPSRVYVTNSWIVVALGSRPWAMIEQQSICRVRDIWSRPLKLRRRVSSFLPCLRMLGEGILRLLSYERQNLPFPVELFFGEASLLVNDVEIIWTE
jgi:hypothetical protein